MYNNKKIKPFVKWAGGKTQLLKHISAILPKDIVSKKFTYIEPFVGSGAMLFWMINNVEHIDKIIINDLNADLINVYNVIKEFPRNLINYLFAYQQDYYDLENDENKKNKYYYDKRNNFNKRNADLIEHAALFIFLNKTCFNGLYRVNSKNEFNVPIGKYKRPLICDEQNIINISSKIQNIRIICGDFEETEIFINENTLIYFDPPYKPLNNTSNFNAYNDKIFNDNEQRRLEKYCEKIDRQGVKWILSNSDMKNINHKNNYFDMLYGKFNIIRVPAKRSINSKSEKRGLISELLITNYETKDLRKVA